MSFDYSALRMRYRIGLGGNHYFTSRNRDELIDICTLISKSPNSIYWNDKYETYVIRIKSDFHKKKIKSLGVR